MRLRTISISLCLLAIVTLAQPASAVCNNATLKGLYGYYHGRTAGALPLTIVVGQIVADGAGGLTGSFTMSLSGSISTGTFTGSYFIAANCTGGFTFSSEDDSPAGFNIVLDDSHKGFQIIQTDNGFDQPGFGLAQTINCGLTGTKQTFASNLIGTLISTSQAEGIVGRIVLDGHGNLGGTETFSVGGIISVVPVTGTYTVSGDCLGTVQIIPSGFPTENFNMVVVNQGKEMLLIETDATTLIEGTVQQ